MGKSADEIMREYNRRRTENVGRDEDYRYLHAVYHGLFNKEQRSRDAMDGRGRTILRDNRRGERSNPLVANLLKAIADDYVSLTGMLPDIKVPPPGKTPLDQEFADRIEHFHYGVWHASNMTIQLKQMAWWNSVLGGCAAVVWPNFRRKHAEIRMTDPGKVYGTPDIVDPFAYSSAVVVERYPVESISDYFPQEVVQEALARLGQSRDPRYATNVGKDLGMVEIVRWFDKDEVVTVMAHEVTDIREKKRRGGDSSYDLMIEMGRARHNLGTCLVVPFQNILVPGEVRGMGDLEQSIGLNQHINFLLNSNEEYVLQELFAPLVLIDPQKAPDDINLSSPTAVIPINAGGNAFRLVTSTAGEQVMAAQLGRGQQLIEYVTGDPQVRTEGRLKSAISTGRAIEKAQGPMFGRVEYRNDLNSFRLEKVNEIALMLTEEMFPNDEFALFGRDRKRGGMFRDKMKGSDLQGYTFNKVLYSPSMHMGFGERLVAVLQMRGATPRPLADERTAIEMLGISDHPEEMMARIEYEMKADAKLQASIKSMLETPAPGPSGPGGPASAMAPVEEQVALEGGATPKGPPAPAPSAEAMTMPGAGQEMMASAVPQTMTPALPPMPASTSGFEGAPELVDQIRKILSPLRLQGDVYLIDATPEKIRLVATDYVTARRAGRVLRQSFGDRVSIREGRIPPGAEQVATGTEQKGAR